MTSVLEKMPTESGQALRYGEVIASGWYPVGWYRELFGASVEVSGNIHIAREIGRASIRREINGVHRMLFRILSVETLQKQGARFFQSYFRPTEVRVTRVGDRQALIHYSNCHGFDRNLWLEQVGCIEELLTQAGTELPRVRILAGGGDGDERCEVETRWR
ncbi:MAG: hypothetical protein U0263_03740 [Polyangiaceae bacterium]